VAHEGPAEGELVRVVPDGACHVVAPIEGERVAALAGEEVAARVDGLEVGPRTAQLSDNLAFRSMRPETPSARTREVLQRG
jgi:hypothetical protein